jgi:hypothetical protein
VIHRTNLSILKCCFKLVHHCNGMNDFSFVFDIFYSLTCLRLTRSSVNKKSTYETILIFICSADIQNNRYKKFHCLCAICFYSYFHDEQTRPNESLIVYSIHVLYVNMNIRCRSNHLFIERMKMKKKKEKKKYYRVDLSNIDK